MNVLSGVFIGLTLMFFSEEKRQWWAAVEIVTRPYPLNSASQPVAWFCCLQCTNSFLLHRA